MRFWGRDPQYEWARSQVQSAQKDMFGVRDAFYKKLVEGATPAQRTQAWKTGLDALQDRMTLASNKLQVAHSTFVLHECMELLIPIPETSDSKSWVTLAGSDVDILTVPAINDLRQKIREARHQISESRIAWVAPVSAIGGTVVGALGVIAGAVVAIVGG